MNQGSQNQETGAPVKTHAAATGGGSALKRYQKLIVGKRGLLPLAYFEWCQLLSVVPGAAGLFLRKMFWPRLFGSCGPGCAFGFGVVLRQPHRIHLGAKVVVSDGCILDARHQSETEVLVLGDDCTLSNNVMISCKEGTVSVGDHVGIGAGTIIQGTHGNRVEIADEAVIGPMCYIVAGGNYETGQGGPPIGRRPIVSGGKVEIGKGAWLGGRVTVLDNAALGPGSIAAAGAVVTKDIPADSVCMGVPAKVRPPKAP